MTATVVGPPVMTGDGTSASSRTRARWRRWRGWVALAAVLVLIGVVLVLPQPRTSGERYAVDNPGASGARAVAQILARQGVEITAVHTAAAAAAAARPGDTLAVLGDTHLTGRDLATVRRSAADLVLVDFAWDLGDVLPGVSAGYGSSTTTTRSAGCDDPDAVAAGQITARSSLWVDPGTAATVCFASDDDGGDADTLTGSYLVTTADGRRVTALADATPLLNSALAKEGNAALALRVLGRNEHLVWYVPRVAPSGGSSSVGAWDVLPPAARLLAWLALAVAVLAALWRGRRLGPVVAERLPVVVPAVEATLGRARLYRKMRSQGRAAAALRAGTALRLGTRLGLPRSAPARDLTEAVARSSGRPTWQVEQLVYGPPPHDAAGLITLAQELERLESEVHHP